MEDEGATFRLTIWLWDFPPAEPVIVMGEGPVDVAALEVSVSVDFPLTTGVKCELTPLGKPEVLKAMSVSDQSEVD